MLEGLWDQFQTLLGYENDVSEVGLIQMALRTILIYLFTLIIVRLGNKRFLSEASAFDVIVSIMLGSIMSRAINSSAPLLPTLGAGAVILALHWLFAQLSVRTEWFGSIVKGNPVLLVKDGEIQSKGMRGSTVTRNDLLAAVRLQMNHADLSKIKRAYLERSGKISIIPYEREAQVVDISVADGVQTVRVEIARSAPDRQQSDDGLQDRMSRG